MMWNLIMQYRKLLRKQAIKILSPLRGMCPKKPSGTARFTGQLMLTAAAETLGFPLV